MEPGDWTPPDVHRSEPDLPWPDRASPVGDQDSLVPASGPAPAWRRWMLLGAAAVLLVSIVVVAVTSLILIAGSPLGRRLRLRLAARTGRTAFSLAGHDLVAEVRAGTGLLAAVEIAEGARAADPGIGARLVTEIRERGVITRLLRGVALQISPPFVITEAEIDRIAEVFAAALDAVAAGQRSAHPS